MPNTERGTEVLAAQAESHVPAPETRAKKSLHFPQTYPEIRLQEGLLLHAPKLCRNLF